MPAVQLNVNKAPITYCTLVHAPVNDPKFANNVITDVAQKCYQEIQAAQLGWGHTIGKVGLSTLAYAGPKITFMGGPLCLAYCYRYELLNLGAECLTKQAAQMTVGAAASLGALQLAGKKLGFNPMSIGANAVVNWSMYIYASTIEKLCNVASNSVASRFDQQARKVEETTRQNHQAIIDSLSDAYNGLGEDLCNRFLTADSLEKKYKVLKVAEKLEKRLPEISKAFGSLGLSETESARVLEKLVGAIGQIGLALEADLEETEEAAVHNYELLVKLGEKVSVAACVPAAVDQCLQAAKQQRLGFGHTIKGLSASAVSGAITSIAAPALSAAAVAVSNYAGYDVLGTCAAKVCELGVSVTSETLGTAALGAVAVASVAMGAMKAMRVQRNYATERQQADAAVTKNSETAQLYLNKVFADVKKNMKDGDQATIALLLPKWKAEIEKRPELDADQALSVFNEKVLA